MSSHDTTLEQKASVAVQGVLHSDLLDICIPTYNRAELLGELLDLLLPEVIAFKMSIYISDNGSTDQTPETVASYQKRYAKIHYNKNLTNLGPDRNFEKVLKMGAARYVWLLGDSSRIKPGYLGNLIKRLGIKNYDAVLLNGAARVQSIISSIVPCACERLQRLS